MTNTSPTRTIIRGDSDLFKISFFKRSNTHTHDYRDKCIKKSEDTPIDITGWDIRFTVRSIVPDSSVITDTDAVITKQAQIVNATGGIAAVYVTSEDTYSLAEGNYLYDIQVVRPVDEFGHNQVNSIRKGKYVVVSDITRGMPEVEEDTDEEDATE